MQAKFYRIFVPTAFIALMASACGQKPSFKEETVTEAGGRGRIDDHGAEDATNPNPVGSSNPNKSTPAGDETTAGDSAGNDTPNDETDGGPDGGGGKPDDDPRNPNGDKPDGDPRNPNGDKPDNDPRNPNGGTDGDPRDPDGDDRDPPRKLITREMSFPSHVVGSADVTKDLDQAYLTQDMTLKRAYNEKSSKETQLTRPQANDQFDQGHTGAENTEVFDQLANRLLDILVIIDNSNSMKEEQENLAPKLNPLLSAIQDTDWRVAVVTTDPDQGSLRKLINKGDADASQKFAQAVTAGVNGSNNERGVLQAVRSLAGYGMPSTWVRDDSNLAVLIVSDEDNCSNGADCPGKAYAEGKYLYDYLAQIRSPGQNARVYGILWHTSLEKSACPTALNRGDIYSKLISDTKGTWGSICDDDYTATLNDVSKNILVTLKSRFTLKYQPDPSTLRVFFNSTEINTGYTVNGKVVEFNPPPSEGTKVTFTYKYGAQPLKKSFPLSYKPMADRLYVTVNGQIVPADDYVYNAATQSIDFKVAPADKAKISVVYTRDLALKTQFEVGDTIKAGTLSVFVNGVPSNDYTVKESTGTVTFNVAPAEGANIIFNYTAVGAPILIYPFKAPYGNPVDLYPYDTVTLAPIRATYTFGFLAINPLDFIEGRSVTLRYDNVARQKFDVSLPNAPLANSVKALGGTKRCEGTPFIVITGMNVNVDNCGFADDVAQVKVSYDYVVAAYQEYTFAVDNLPKPTEYQEWKVFVNDQLRTDYVRAGNVITFSSALPVGSVVKIQLIQQVY